MKTKKFVLQKLIEMVLTIFVVTVLSFLLMRLSPVDPATAYAKRSSPLVTEEQIENAKQMLGLDKPLVHQYFTWAGKALKGDFGVSLRTGQPVTKELAKGAGFTLTLVALSGCFIFIGVLIFGTLNYLLRHHVLGWILRVLFIAGLAIPPFYLAILYLDVFSLRLGWMSISSNTGLIKFVIPALCLSALGIGLYALMLGKNLETEMQAPYVHYLRCRGMGELRILCFHALPHGLLKIVPSLMQMLGLFMTGAAVVESVCSLPGLGHTIVDSVIQRDSPMIHGQVLILAIGFVSANLLSDLVGYKINKQRKLYE